MPEAAWSVGLRMALYQRAFLNLGVNTGPMGLCWLNETTRYATCKMATPGVPQTTPESFRHLGFELFGRHTGARGATLRVRGLLSAGCPDRSHGLLPYLGKYSGKRGVPPPGHDRASGSIDRRERRTLLSNVRLFRVWRDAA